MAHDPDAHRRRSIRLPAYDYALPGAYFITVVTKDRQAIFGEVVDGIMQHNALGEVVRDEWLRSAEVRREIELDTWVLMPNHLHAIVVITASPSAAGVPSIVWATGRSPLPRVARGPTPKSTGSLVGGFKSASTRRINLLRGTPGSPVWQRNYYEHAVRDDEDLDRIRQYILDNPLRWEADEYNLSH